MCVCKLRIDIGFLIDILSASMKKSMTTSDETDRLDHWIIGLANISK